MSAPGDRVLCAVSKDYAADKNKRLLEVQSVKVGIFVEKSFANPWMFLHYSIFGFFFGYSIPLFLSEQLKGNIRKNACS